MMRPAFPRPTQFGQSPHEKKERITHTTTTSTPSRQASSPLPSVARSGLPPEERGENHIDEQACVACEIVCIISLVPTNLISAALQLQHALQRSVYLYSNDPFY
mmetsp:Transcript_37607/g.69105  ORF Transcript_37607/g.69105 Transcript_37607/m.69105 type:complete len:104 (-) Transcript_37607:280-591(-)